MCLTFAFFFGEDVGVRDTLRTVAIAYATRVLHSRRIDSPIASYALQRHTEVNYL
jgi:hypothetical protein